MDRSPKGSFQRAEKLYGIASKAFNEDRADLIERVNDSLALATEVNAREIIANSLLLRSEYYLFKGDRDLAEPDLLQVEELFNHSEGSTWLGIQMRYYFLQGNIAFLDDNFQEAREHFLRALKFATQHKDARYQSILNQQLGFVLSNMGDVQGAISYFLSAIRVFPLHLLLEDDQPDPSVRLLALHNYAHMLVGVAELCILADDTESAQNYLDEALKVGTSSPVVLGELYRLYASVYLTRGESKDALKAAKQSLAMSTDSKAHHGNTANSIRTLAEVLIYTGEFKTAIALLENTTIDDIRDSSWQCEVSCLLSIAYAQLAILTDSQTNRESSLHHILQSEELLKHIDPRAPFHLKFISDAKYLLGDVDGAYKALLKSDERRKELFSAKVRNEIGSLRLLIKIEREEHERGIERMKREQVEKELSATTMHLAMQSELLGNFRNDLRRIVRDIDEPIAALKKIKEKLKDLPCEQIDWVKFEKQFTDVHPEFKMKLIEKYPDLTKQEVKMCQLARLGLKNFEMSRLLCLSERTVEGHRLNLRKKLGVKTEEKLSDFLASV